MADQITKSIIVKGDALQIYRLWADFENFPRFMQNIESVRKNDDGSSHWVMSGPLGSKVEWDAETTRLDEGKRIAWNSKDRSPVTTSGQVLFNSLPQGETEITVTLHYDPPAGLPGEVVAQLFARPEARLETDLRNFKAYAENMRAQARAQR